MSTLCHHYPRRQRRRHFQPLTLEACDGIAAVVGGVETAGAVVAAGADSAKGKAAARAGERAVPVDNAGTGTVIKQLVEVLVVAQQSGGKTIRRCGWLQLWRLQNPGRGLAAGSGQTVRCPSESPGG